MDEYYEKLKKMILERRIMLDDDEKPKFKNRLDNTNALRKQARKFVNSLATCYTDDNFIASISEYNFSVDSSDIFSTVYSIIPKEDEIDSFVKLIVHIFYYYHDSYFIKNLDEKIAERLKEGRSGLHIWIPIMVDFIYIDLYQETDQYSKLCNYFRVWLNYNDDADVKMLANFLRKRGPVINKIGSEEHKNKKTLKKKMGEAIQGLIKSLKSKIEQSIHEANERYQSSVDYIKKYRNTNTPSLVQAFKQKAKVEELFYGLNQIELASGEEPTKETAEGFWYGKQFDLYETIDSINIYLPEELIKILNEKAPYPYYDISDEEIAKCNVENDDYEAIVTCLLSKSKEHAKNLAMFFKKYRESPINLDDISSLFNDLFRKYKPRNYFIIVASISKRIPELSTHIFAKFESHLLENIQSIKPDDRYTKILCSILRGFFKCQVSRDKFFDTVNSIIENRDIYLTLPYLNEILGDPKLFLREQKDLYGETVKNVYDECQRNGYVLRSVSYIRFIKKIYNKVYNKELLKETKMQSFVRDLFKRSLSGDKPVGDFSNIIYNVLEREDSGVNVDFLVQVILCLDLYELRKIRALASHVNKLQRLSNTVGLLVKLVHGIVELIYGYLDYPIMNQLIVLDEFKKAMILLASLWKLTSFCNFNELITFAHYVMSHGRPQIIKSPPNSSSIDGYNRVYPMLEFLKELHYIHIRNLDNDDADLKLFEELVFHFNVYQKPRTVIYLDNNLFISDREHFYRSLKEKKIFINEDYKPDENMYKRYVFEIPASTSITIIKKHEKPEERLDVSKFKGKRKTAVGA